MKYLITESQKHKVIKDLILNNGFETAIELVGEDFLINTVFNNNPLEFLNIFSNLPSTRDFNETTKRLFINYYHNDKVLLREYENSEGYKSAFVKKDDIWDYLIYDFFLDEEEAHELCTQWFRETYNPDIEVCYFFY